MCKSSVNSAVSVSCCRRSCSACSLADLRGWSAFLKTAMRFLCFASRSSSLSHSSMRTSRGGPFVVASVFVPVSYLFLALLTILRYFDVATMSAHNFITLCNAQTICFVVSGRAVFTSSIVEAQQQMTSARCSK